MIDCFDPDCAASADCPALPLGSNCAPGGGTRGDIIQVSTAYRASGNTTMPTFTIPAGANKAIVFISSETSVISSPTTLQEQTDEDFISVSAVLDLVAETSSGYMNYARSTQTAPNSPDVNLYGWIDLAVLL